MSMKICRCHIEFVFDGCDVYNAASELAEIIRRAGSEHVIAAKVCRDCALRENILGWDDEEGAK